LEHSIKQISDSMQEMIITFAQEELEPTIEKKIRELQPKLNLKGFRKGKVPPKMVRKLYGKEIEFEAKHELSNEYFNKIVDDEKIKVVGTPSLKDIKDVDGNVDVTIEYEVLPQFELEEYKGLTLDEPVHNVEEDEIEQEIEAICKNNGDLENADEILDNEFIVGLSLTEIDEATGVPLIGTEEQKIQVYLADKTVIPELRDKLMNKMVGDSFNFNPRGADPMSPDTNYKVTVTSIQKLIPKEFTNEFVATYSKGKFVTTDDLREELGFKLQEQWDERSRKEMEDQIVNKLVSMHDIDPPDSVLENVMQSMVDNLKKQYKTTPGAENLTVDMMRNDLMPAAIHQTKWTMIRTAIIEKEQLEVEDYDVEPMAQQEAAKYGANADIMMKNLMKNKDFRESILSKKLLELILDFAITEEMTFDEYREKYYPEHHHHDHEHDHDHDHEHDHEHHHDHDHESNIITPGEEDKTEGGIIIP
jgi:trigger factor